MLLLVGAALIAIAAAVPVRLAGATPGWWRPLDAQDPAVLAQAQGMERALTQQLDTRRADGETWTLAVRQEHANQWLASRLPTWVRNQSGRWPADLQQVAVRFDEGVLTLAADVREDPADGPRIMALVVEPTCPAPGVLVLRLADVRVNRLALGRSVGSAAIRAMIDEVIAREPDAKAAADAVLAGAPLPWPLELDLTDGRRVIVEALRVTEGRLEVDCRSVEPGRASADLDRRGVGR